MQKYQYHSHTNFRLFDHSLKRFYRIFKPSKSQKKHQIIGVAGNHDIGFGDTIVHEAYQRYIDLFGGLNQVRKVGASTIVTLDTIGLSSTINNDAKNKAQEFLDSLGSIMLIKTNQLLALAMLYYLRTFHFGDPKMNIAEKNGHRSRYPTNTGTSIKVYSISPRHDSARHQSQDPRPNQTFASNFRRRSRRLRVYT